jgi:hypothetical protein
MMYQLVLVAHAYGRWAVVIAGVAAVAGAAWGLARGRPWEGYPRKLGRLFGVAVDIQVLLGAALYLVFSPMTTVAVNVAEGLPQDSELRFFGLYHGLIMGAAFLDVHVSAAIIRRGRTEAARNRRSLIFYGQTLLVILAAIPWWRPWVRF